MTGQAHWIVFVPILLGFAALALLLWFGVRAERGLYVEERRFRCPTFHEDVIATLVRSAGPSGSFLGVRRCTALRDPETVDCGKECLAQLEQLVAREGAGSQPPSHG